jgi:hypothetical protein
VVAVALCVLPQAAQAQVDDLPPKPPSATVQTIEADALTRWVALTATWTPVQWSQWYHFMEVTARWSPEQWAQWEHFLKVSAQWGPEEWADWDRFSKLNSVDDAIEGSAAEFGLNSQKWRRIAECESGLNPFAVSDGGDYWGLFQEDIRFWEDRVRVFNEEIDPDVPDSDPLNPVTNARVSARLAAMSGYVHWPNCGRR